MDARHGESSPEKSATPALARGGDLHEERVGPATPQKTLALIVMTLVTLLAANFAAGRLLRSHPVNLGYHVIRHKWEVLDAQTRPADWLLLGDSSCNQGLRPDVIARATGETALNLCTIADVLTLSDAWMLDRYLARVGKPKQVLLAHVADVWERGEDEIRGPLIAQIPLPFGFWRELEPRFTLDPAEERQAWLGAHVPLYAENASLGVLLQNPGRLLLPPARFDAGGYMRVDHASGGAQAVASDAAAERARVGKGVAAVSPINRQALLHIVSVAERHALDVTIVSAPLLDELWRFEPFRERTQRVMAEVQEIVRGSPRVRVLATEPVLVSSAELDNSVDHVIHPAAERYTASILRALRDTRPTAP